MDIPSPELTSKEGTRTARAQRDLEWKRAQGEASCAECHRLKLKCDKKIPCSSCLRRGCSLICPNGTLAARQGTSKSILLDTDKLHSKLIEMSRRIRQLEDALQIAHISLSNAPHPLLSNDLLKIKEVADVVEEAENHSTDNDILPNIGLLTVTEHGEARFMGHTGTEAMMRTGMHENGSRLQSKFPAEAAFLTEAFPFALVNLPKRKTLQLISERLPSYERATSLVEAYLAHLSCILCPVDREQIMEELLPRYYKYREEAFAEDERGVTVHNLALLLAVFASGAAGDLTQKSGNEEGELYRQLARCALGLHSVFEGTSICTVQALSLVGAYDIFSATAQSLDTTWKIQSLALCLALSIGLHWDPSRWNLSPKYVQRRRSLFWELFRLDCWKSLGSGRPPIFRLHEVDCRYPEDPEAIIEKDGETLHGFFRWKHDYAKQIVAVVATKLCSVQPMKYSEIMELDRKVREYPDFPVEYLDKLNADGITGVFQALVIALYKEISLIFIHRVFFARALRENPTNPITSRFGPSFLSAYTSAISLLRLMRRNFESCKQILLRIWPFWAHALASGVIIGSVAARDTSELARTALKDLELAIGLFESALDHPVSRNELPMLLRLRDKARRNFEVEKALLSTIVTHEPLILPSPTVAANVGPIDEALSMLGGETRFVTKYKKDLRSSPADTPSSPSRATSSTVEANDAVIKSAPPDTQQLLQSLGIDANAATSHGLNPGEVYAWLHGRAVGRSSEGGNEIHNHNQISFADALYAASGAGHGGASQVNILPTQQQNLQGVEGSGSGSPAFWGFQDATTVQGTSAIAPPYSERNLESPYNISEAYLNAATVYTIDPDPTWLSTTETNALPSMTADNSFGLDFDVEGMALCADPGAFSQLGSGDDTFESAWRSIMEDPRFATTEPGSLFPYAM